MSGHSQIAVSSSQCLHRKVKIHSLTYLKTSFGSSASENQFNSTKTREKWIDEKKEKKEMMMCVSVCTQLVQA